MPDCSTPAPPSPPWAAPMPRRSPPPTLKFDMLFGPAYKGIPLVTVTAAALARATMAATCRSPSTARKPRITARAAGSSAAPCGAGPDRRRRDHRGHRDPRIDRDHPRGRARTPAGVLLALDRQERGADSRFVGGPGSARAIRHSGDRGRQPGRPDAACLRRRARRPTCRGMQAYPGPLWHRRLRNSPWKTRSPLLTMAAASSRGLALEECRLDPLRRAALLAAGALAAPTSRQQRPHALQVGGRARRHPLRRPHSAGIRLAGTARRQFRRASRSAIARRRRSPEQAAAEEQKQLDAEQRQTRDKNLLNTYVSVQEIERLRDQRLTLLADQIKVTSQFLDTLERAHEEAARRQHALQALQRRSRRRRPCRIRWPRIWCA